MAPSNWLESVVSPRFGLVSNNERYHESLDNMTPADVYFGRVEEVKSKRERIKQVTMEERRRQHRQGVPDRLYWNSESSLNLRLEMLH
jgi:hypothetical protein